MIFLSRFKVSGHSMQPVLNPGQEILVTGLPYLFLNPKKGHLIAFRDGEKVIVKRVAEIKNKLYLVKGDNSNDSKSYPWIERKKILGRVVYVLPNLA